MTRERVLVVGACLVTAGAVYLTRAVLDVVGASRGVQRVAMLPSIPELAGIVILVGICAAGAVLLMARAEHPATRGHDRVAFAWPQGAAEVFVPLIGSAWLILPYLPWLPDAAPVLRVFAGPGRVLVWFIVAGQVVWLLAERIASAGRAKARPLRDLTGAGRAQARPLRDLAGAGRAQARPLRGRVTGVRVAIIFFAGLAAFTYGATRLAGTQLYPGGDEPHYLVITQSLLADGDLAIEDNHARGDYADYYAAPLAPHYRTRGADGRIYSIHPIGLPVLIAPAFALGGYRAVVWFLAVVAAAAAALMWRWARQVTGSTAAATFAWAAVAFGAPYYFNSFAVYPEIAGALAVMAVLAPLVTGRHWLAAGLALAALPWLSTKYAPMAGVLAAALVLRAWPSRSRLVRIVAPLAASVAAWFAFFYAIWGSPLPSAPYGPDPQMRVRTLVAGAPGLLLDQEYGVLVYAPALALGFTGLVAMWRARGAARRLSVEITAAFAALLATVGAFGLWWGGSGMPGRPLASGVLLLGIPIAWQVREGAFQDARRGAYRLLVLVTIAITLALLVAQQGLLLAEGRDGASELSRWLSPDRPIAPALPSFILRPREAVVAALAWLAAAAVVITAVRMARLRRGWTDAAVLTSSLAAIVTLVSIWPSPSGAAREADPEARPLAPLIQRFDARARPFAIAYGPLTRVAASDLASRVRLRAASGTRRGPQLVPLLLNARFALAAGEYDLDVVAKPGAALQGPLGLQVGRTGPPMRVWTLAEPPGGRWRQRFAVDVDAEFVGFRGPDTLEAAIAELLITPVRIVDERARVKGEAVIAAALFHSTAVYFHDGRVYPEPTGYWVRGASTAAMTIATRADGSGVRLALRGGERPNSVVLETPIWREQVAVQPNVTRTVTVPPAGRGAIVPLRITARRGFIPAEMDPASNDRRLLGCWVEIVEGTHGAH